MKEQYTLKKNKLGKIFPGPLALIIMDGIGLGPKTAGNAVFQAKTPTLDLLQTTPLYTQLKAHGKAVGMPSDADMGNSEVGHNALGAGRVFDQGAALVQTAITSGSLFLSDTWKSLIANVNTHNSTLHILGLLSDGNVHSHINHLIAMLQKAASQGIKRCRIHALLDGRDVHERSALNYIAKVEAILDKLNTDGRDYRIASGGGRMLITMDRYNADWPMIERGWQTHVLGNARAFSSATDAIQTLYNEDPKCIDQYLPPFVINEDGNPIGPIVDNDSVIMSNFRGDRAIEMSLAFEADDANFPYFDRQRRPKICYAGMMQYDGDLNIPKHFLVDPPIIDGSISQYLCQMGLKSLAISETQKYGHVTYFWNGNKSGYIDKTLETYIEIPSINIPFDQQPEMKSVECTDTFINAILNDNLDFLRLNIANGDMVGHTGNMDAAIKAVEITDTCVNRILEALETVNGSAIILADHGNADEMFVEKNGQKIAKTAHTLNPVPCAIIGPNLEQHYQLNPIDTPGLANVAATICTLLGYQAPDTYEKSLIQEL